MPNPRLDGHTHVRVAFGETHMFASLGEALVDLIEHPDGRYEPCLGGSVCNFTRAVARQGQAIRYLNPLSSDTFGQRFERCLRDDGVAIDPPWTSDRPTSLAVVSLGAAGVPQYGFHREAVADRDGSVEELVARLPERVSLLHVGGLALMPPDDVRALAVIQAARARGALISVDANLRPVVVGRNEVAQMAYRQAVSRTLAEADVVKLSDEDIAALGWFMKADDDATLLAVARRLLDGLGGGRRATLVAITLGGQGAALVHAQGLVRRPVASEVPVVDTVGAGDCFQAGLLTWLHQAGRLTPWGLSQLTRPALDDALGHAMASAALNVQRQGCQPPSWQETRAWVAQHG
jgi:fructokinase